MYIRMQERLYAHFKNTENVRIPMGVVGKLEERWDSLRWRPDSKEAED